MKNKTHKIVISSLLAALTCIATIIIKIPSPLKGYINLGDGVVLLSGWLLSPLYGFLAAGIGSSLADLFSGYATYAPATFLIKGIMALSACLIFKYLNNKTSQNISKVISAIIAEVIMISGYFIFEGFLYGFIPSLVNIIPNSIQGFAGLIVGIILYKIFEKVKH